MTEADKGTPAVDTLVAGLIQQLTERLGVHGLGEIEVRDGDIRVRVTGPATAAAARPAAAPPASTPHPSAVGRTSHARGASHGAPPAGADAHGVLSPAVGYFAYAEGLGPGLAVEKGDALGHVEVLGVRHDVRAPRSGVVRNLVTEAGEAVEYGQLLVELQAVAS